MMGRMALVFDRLMRWCEMVSAEIRATLEPVRD